MADEFPIEDLMRHSSWLRTLARNLVGDSSRAVDLVQATGVAAPSPPELVPERRPAWLSSVLRRLALRSHRDRFRRRAREERHARMRGEPVDPQALLERGELQKRIVSAVLELDEPYRTTVLLHYYE